MKNIRCPLPIFLDLILTSSRYLFNLSKSSDEKINLSMRSSIVLRSLMAFDFINSPNAAPKPVIVWLLLKIRYVNLPYGLESIFNSGSICNSSGYSHPGNWRSNFLAIKLNDLTNFGKSIKFDFVSDINFIVLTDCRTSNLSIGSSLSSINELYPSIKSENL